MTTERNLAYDQEMTQDRFVIVYGCIITTKEERALAQANNPPSDPDEVELLARTKEDPLIVKSRAILQAVSRKLEEHTRPKRPGFGPIRDPPKSSGSENEGRGWQLGETDVWFSRAFLEFLEMARANALKQQDTQGEHALRIQRTWRGHHERSKNKAVTRAWRQLRQALAQALRAQFFKDGSEGPDKKVSGVDELQTVVQLIKTLKQLGKDAHNPEWNPDLICQGATQARQHVQAVIQAKYALQQVLQAQKDKTAKAHLAELHTCKERLEVLSYALQEAQRVDMSIVRKVPDSPFYLFNPLYDGETDSLVSMQTLPEFTAALRAYQTLRMVGEALPPKMKLVYSSARMAEEVRQHIQQVDSLQIGPLQDIEIARDKLQEVEELTKQLEDAAAAGVKDPVENAPVFNALMDRAKKMGLQRSAVEQVRVLALEAELKMRLKQAMLLRNVSVLGEAIQFAMEAMMKEGERRKQRKQRKLRLRWLAKKKERALTPEEQKELDLFENEKEVVLDVDDDIQEADALLRSLLEQDKSGKAPVKSDEKAQEHQLLRDISSREEKVFELALAEAAGALDTIKAAIEEKETAEERNKGLLGRAKAALVSTLAEANDALEMLAQDQGKRSNFKDLSRPPKDLAPGRVSDEQLMALRAKIDTALKLAAEARIQPLPKGETPQTGAEDEKRCADLHNCLLEVDDHLHERHTIDKHMAAIMNQIAQFADADAKVTDQDMDRLGDRIGILLTNARLAAVDETKLKTLQEAHDAITSRNANALAHVIELALKQRATKEIPGPAAVAVAAARAAGGDKKEAPAASPASPAPRGRDKGEEKGSPAVSAIKARDPKAKDKASAKERGQQMIEEARRKETEKKRQQKQEKEKDKQRGRAPSGAAAALARSKSPAAGRSAPAKRAGKLDEASNRSGNASASSSAHNLAAMASPRPGTMDRDMKEAADSLMRFNVEESDVKKPFDDAPRGILVIESGPLSDEKDVSEIASVRDKMSKALLQVTRLMQTLNQNITERSKMKDLVSRPARDGALMKGRIRDMDLYSAKKKIEEALEAAIMLGLEKDVDHQDVSDAELEDMGKITELRNNLLELNVHIDEREQAYAQVEQMLIDAAQYPFSTNTGEHVEPYVADEELEQLDNRMRFALGNGRLIGLAEEQLSVLQDVYADLCVYCSGRVEARAEADKILKMLQTVHIAHPKLYDSEQFSVMPPPISEHPADAKHIAESEDQDLVSVSELIKATLKDCELVGLPPDEPAIVSLQGALKAMRIYLSARVQVRQELQVLIERPADEVGPERIAVALDFARKTGLANNKVVKKPNPKNAPGTMKKIADLQERLALLQAQLDSPAPPVQKPHSGKEQPMEEYAMLIEQEKQLNALVPEARRQLNVAMASKNAEQLTHAIQYAKNIELKLQKIRQQKKLLGRTS